ncbi:MAG: thioredoxin [Lentimicrobiaceae bacterium]|nr:thioredoxin [Lentimicrobiaceae bacterium]
MKKITLITLFSALFLFSGITLAGQTGKKPELLTKETFKQKIWNYEASPNEFKYLGDKPCLIDLYADWCGWCKKIAPFIEELGNTYAKEIYVYKINTDKQKELQALFQAQGLPTVIFIPMKGQPTAIRGAQSKEKYDQLIQQLLLEK